MSEAGALADVADKEAIRDLIQHAAARLDDEALEAWLDLFAAESEYELTTYGPEIRYSMTWWKSTRDELKSLLDEVHQHVRDPGRRRHVVSPVSIAVDGDQAAAMSHFAVFRTDQDGHSAVYAVGRYEDSLVKQGGRWLYRSHRAVLDTRMLDMFTHLPL